MVDPHDGYLSFQNELRNGNLVIGETASGSGVFSHFDMPEYGVRRLTYINLAEDKETVTAFVSCLFNGEVDGHPCLAIGYAVPEKLRNQGRASKLVADVVEDAKAQFLAAGVKKFYVEAVIDIENIASRKVAEKIFNVEPESITDRLSGRPALRYTLEVYGGK